MCCFFFSEEHMMIDIHLKSKHLQSTFAALSKTAASAAVAATSSYRGYCSKVSFADLKYANQLPFSTGKISGKGQHVQHSLYYEQYGNPAGEPVMFVHGGPGGACSPGYCGFFNPQRYRVILLDQRGCGKSTPSVSEDPFVALQDNTTQHLIDDMIALREALGIKGKMHVFGGSWGSSLSLAFAIAHPNLVQTLILRGIFLVRKKDLDYFYQGNAATFHLNPFTSSTVEGAYAFFPDAWRSFVEVIPVEKRHDMVKAYAEIFAMKPTTPEIVAIQDKAAVTWSVWEGITSYLAQDVSNVDRFADPIFAKAFAKIENHYFMHGAFWGPRETQNYLLENAATIASLPIHIVQGRFDIVCPMFQADELVATLRKHGAGKVDYRVVPAGHSQLERETAEQLIDIMDHLPVMTV